MAKIPPAAMLPFGRMFPSTTVESIRCTGEVAEFTESEVLRSIKFIDQQDVVILARWQSEFA